MEASLTSTSSQTEERRRAGRRLAARRPLVVRKQMDRRAARQRVVARANTTLTTPQRGFDPLARSRRLVALGLAVLGSLVLHVGIAGFGIAIRLHDKAASRQKVTIEMRQKAPEPPPEKKPPPPEPVEKPTVRPPPKAKAPPPQPVDEPKPVRVVGLSMESATEGGSGPSFAVGNTRLGETAEKAVAPKEIPAAPSGPAPAGPVGPGKSNRVASRIPVAGVKYELPKRKNPLQPPYPATLKSQGIEGDVPILVSIDETGKVVSVKILKESPYPEFNEAARTTALGEEYEPATRDGVAMPYSLSFTYRFRLEDQ